MRTFSKAALALAMIIVLAGAVQAQPPGPGPGMGMGMGMMGPGLLMAPAMQEELKLDSSQVDKIRDFAQDMREKMRDQMTALQNLEGAERREKGEAMRREMTEKVNKALGAILKPEQLKRYHQIELQAGGPMAFADPKVQSELKLTDEQKSKLREIVTDLMGQARTAMEQGQDDRAAAMRKVMSLRKEATAKAVALLTDDQKKTWNELTGKPFEMPAPPRRPQP